MVEELIASPVWTDVIAPVFSESVASVSGRMTNGYWFHGSLTREVSKDNSLMYSGYQKGVMDVWNRIIDFVKAKEQLEEKMKEDALGKKAPIINPFLEDFDG